MKKAAFVLMLLCALPLFAATATKKAPRPKGKEMTTPAITPIRSRPSRRHGGHQLKFFYDKAPRPENFGPRGEGLYDRHDVHSHSRLQIQAGDPLTRI